MHARMNSNAAIRKSVGRARTHASQHTRSMVNWFRPIREQPTAIPHHTTQHHTHQQQHPPDNLVVHDAMHSQRTNKRDEPQSARRSIGPDPPAASVDGISVTKASTVTTATSSVRGARPRLVCCSSVRIAQPTGRDGTCVTVASRRVVPFREVNN
mmetsp:Transcript_12139/g.25555  ORF Transcript_12139/g.25555 Transcript_12139/m.25555 type:complete len:155 (+) Transcript_12139:2274-2738(+)